MSSTINYKDTLFNQASLAKICCETTFKMIHKLQNEIKANANPINFNLVGGVHGHLGLVLSDAQYAHILNTPFVYPTRLSPLIIPDDTTAHANSNTRTAHTKEVRLFPE